LVDAETQRLSFVMAGLVPATHVDALPLAAAAAFRPCHNDPCRRATWTAGTSPAEVDLWPKRSNQPDRIVR